MIRKGLFAGLLFTTLFLYSYRENPYIYSPAGTISLAVGNDLVWSYNPYEAPLLNPATLSDSSSNRFYYEFQGALRFRGINTDYRLNINSISALSLSWIGASENRFAFSYNTIFRSLDANTSGANPFQAGDLGLSWGRPLGSKAAHSVGVHVGVLLFEENRAWHWGPGYRIGAGFYKNQPRSYGLFYQSPYRLTRKTNPFSDFDETTPAILSIGGKQRLGSYGHIGLEFQYKAWDAVVSDVTPDAGKHAFDYGQNWLPKTSVHLKSDGQSFFGLGTPPAETRARRKKVIEELATLSYDPEMQELTASMRDLQESLQPYYLEKRKMDKLEQERRDPEKRKLLVGERRQVQRQIKSLQTELSSTQLLIGDAEYKKEVSNSLTSLENQLESNSLALQELYQVDRSAEEETRYQSLVSNIEVLDSAIAEQQKKRLAILKERREREVILNNKKAKNLPLSEAEKADLEKISKRKELEAELKELNQTLKRQGKMVVPKGDYYFAFRPEVVYNTDGSYRKIGILSFGLHIRPQNLERLYFTMAVSDQSLLKWLGLYPQNDLVEVLRISASYPF